MAGADGEDLALDYQAGGAFATVEGEGEIAVEIDGEWTTLPSIRSPASAPSPSTPATRPTAWYSGLLRV